MVTLIVNIIVNFIVTLIVNIIVNFIVTLIVNIIVNFIVNLIEKPQCWNKKKERKYYGFNLHEFKMHLLLKLNKKGLGRGHTDQTFNIC